MKLISAKAIYGLQNFVKVGDEYMLTSRMCVSLHTDKGEFLMDFDYGFRTDGLSVPKLFRRFLPAWDKSNMRYNLAGIVHDALYGNEGFGKFTREECDDIFRGLLRESGISRFKAGCADKAVEWFACMHFKKDPKCSGVKLSG